ncbi:hypothetical protein IE53DRAFT_25271 [Violaceomyces palustris]|uniref:Uncharacterized protein n=1 Tax=Violaceomyces palustris TaxID=1673888 RepID=A0ACD0NL73_9BASI|nr:hypothetical protein IE53DRAFT_25271 [Violaceomyces palustris]
MAVATGAVYLFRSLGQVIGLALSGSFFQSSLSQQLSLRIREVILSRGGSGATGEEEVTRIVESIRHDASLIPNLPAPLREASRQSYEVCLKRLFLLMTLLNLLNVLFCWWIKEKGFNDTAAKKTAVTISQEDSEDVERAVGDA